MGRWGGGNPGGRLARALALRRGRPAGVTATPAAHRRTPSPAALDRRRGARLSGDSAIFTSVLTSPGVAKGWSWDLLGVVRGLLCLHPRSAQRRRAQRALRAAADTRHPGRAAPAILQRCPCQRAWQGSCSM
jgi:hypothetical protein